MARFYQRSRGSLTNEEEAAWTNAERKILEYPNYQIRYVEYMLDLREDAIKGLQQCQNFGPNLKDYAVRLINKRMNSDG
jgi:hypothetical protein